MYLITNHKRWPICAPAQKKAKTFVIRGLHPISNGAITQVGAYKSC